MPHTHRRAIGRYALSSISIHIMAASSLLGALLSGCGSGASVSSCLTCGGVTPPPLIDTTTTMAAPTGPLSQGQPVQFAISVTPAPTTGAETVTLNDVTGNTSAYDVPTKLGTGTLQNGTVTVTVNPPHAGIRTYQVTYNSDGTYAASTASTQVTVVAPSSASSCGLGSSAYVVSSGSAAPNQTAFAAITADQSAVCAQNSGTTLTLNSPAITKSGTDTFTGTTGSFAYGGDPSGIDAGVLAYGSSTTAASGATINLQGTPSITASSADYAAFASGDGATLNISNATISSTGSGATLGAGYSGQINVSNSQVTSDGALLTIINSGTAVLQNTALTSSTYGTLVFAGPTSGANTTSVFQMDGGSISAGTPLFVLTGSQTANITLSNVDFTKSAITPQDNWDINPSTIAPTLQLTLDNQTMQGIVTGSANSTLTLKNGSSLNGDFFGGGSVSLDASSSWMIHSSFTLQVFNDPGGISGSQVSNVTGNGQTISYSNALNPNLGGLTYSLLGGGSLKPY
jgi:hypothetical protein